MDSATLTALDPKTLGFWAKCIREASHWSQEAVAASAGLDVRTIQRIEAGKSASITTRRALARGLGYENQDIFQDPTFIATAYGLLNDLQAGNRERLEAQFPDHMRLPVTRVASGDALGSLADVSEATLLNADESLSPEAKEIAASLFDYLRDIVDISADASFSDKLAYTKDMDAMLRSLEGLGTAVYSAIRSTKMAGAFWTYKTPIPITIGYLTVVPSDRSITEIMVPRRLS
jgi:transcriptional regulator with XRE-family HTH domain